MNENRLDELSESLSAPIGDIIASIARGVADAQHALDESTIKIYMEIYQKDDGFMEALRQIGYQPTWYKIPEVNAEVVMSLSVDGNSSIDAGANSNAAKPPLKLYAAPIDAHYSNRFNFDVKAASRISFKIVPVPPSPKAEEIKVVPRLTGKSLGETARLLRMLNIDFLVDNLESKDISPNDSRHVKESNPKAGTILRPGQILNITTTQPVS